MRDMKDSGVEWIEEIPQGWQIVPLKQVFAMGKGLSITKADLVEEGLPVISYGQIHARDANGTQIKPQHVRYVAWDNRNLTLSALAYVGDIIVADTSEDLDGCGNAVYVDMPEIYAGYHCVLLRNTGAVSGKYVAYLMQTDAWRSQIRTSVMAVKVYSVAQNVLSRTSILVPPMATQQRIAEYLDAKCQSMDALTANLEAQIEKLAEYRQALITQAVTKGLDPNAPMKDSGIEWIGGTPAHWKRVRMAALYEPTSENADESLPILTVSIADGVSDREIGNEERTRQVIYGEDRSKYRRVQPGDLVYNTMRAWQGALGAVSVHGAVSPAYVTVRPQGEVNSQFVQFLLRTDAGIQEMHRLSYGVADFRLRLYWESFRTIHISLPPLEEQNRIVEHCNRINDSVKALVDTRRQQIEKLEEYRKSLIFDYVTGKREVPASFSKEHVSV